MPVFTYWADLKRIAIVPYLHKSTFFNLNTYLIYHRVFFENHLDYSSWAMSVQQELWAANVTSEEEEKIQLLQRAVLDDIAVSLSFTSPSSTDSPSDQPYQLFLSSSLFSFALLTHSSHLHPPLTISF